MKNSNKKYYWLKLKEDFFDDDTIQFIEEQENGIVYSNFYLKLCLKSIRTDGKLMRLIGNNLMPYDVRSLARLTRVPADTVAVAMKLFEQMGLVERLETGEIYLAQINELIGAETEKAALMRRKRAEDRLNGNNVTEIGNNVTPMLPERYPEIEIDIRDRDKREDIEIKDIDILPGAETPPSRNSNKNDLSEPAVISLTLNDKSQFPITETDVQNWQELYPAVNILQELRNMKGWLDANPAKRKTKSGIKRFVNGWLSREQDKYHPDIVPAQVVRSQPYQQQPPQASGNVFLQMLAEEEARQNE